MAVMSVICESGKEHQCIMQTNFVLQGRTVWHWGKLSSKGLNFSLETEERNMGLIIREVGIKHINMSPAKVKRYFHNPVIDDSNVVTKPTNTRKCIKVYYIQIVLYRGRNM
jgi:hypothetical protein